MKSVYAAWLPVLRSYLLISAPGHLAWETAQLPLYTIFWTQSPGEIAFAVAHCTAGDMLIALAAFALGVITVQGRSETRAKLSAVGSVTIVFGIAYTIFSEWLNVSLRQRWAYTTMMPLLPLGIGLAPVLQWLVVPGISLWLAARWSSRRT